MSRDVLVVDLNVYGNLIFGTILEQNNNVIIRGDFSFESTQGVTIESSDMPDIDISCDRKDITLFIRGEKASSDNVVFFDDDVQSNEQALEVARKIRQAIDELNENFKLEDEVVDNTPKVTKI